MTILEHITKIQEDLNSMVDKMDDDTYYYDATYHLEQIKRVEQEPKIVPIAEIKFDDDKLHEIVEEAVKNIEIEIESKWIPVSERLPKENGRYLVTIQDFGQQFVKVVSFATNLSLIDKYDFNGKKQAGWYDYDSEYGHYELDDVIAWQPLPEPYKESEVEQ